MNTFPLSDPALTGNPKWETHCLMKALAHSVVLASAMGMASKYLDVLSRTVRQ